METFKDFQQMGRFTLRDEGKISGGGGVGHDYNVQPWSVWKHSRISNKWEDSH